MELPVYVLIIICAVATMIPRFTPYFVRLLDRLPGKIRHIMSLLPVAALGALIFPATILDYQASAWYAGLIGVTAAFIASWHINSMIVPVIVSVAATYLALLI